MINKNKQKLNSLFLVWLKCWAFFMAAIEDCSTVSLRVGVEPYPNYLMWIWVWCPVRGFLSAESAVLLQSQGNRGNTWNLRLWSPQVVGRRMLSWAEQWLLPWLSTELLLPPECLARLCGTVGLCILCVWIQSWDQFSPCSLCGRWSYR